MAENMIDLNGLVHVWSKVKTLTDNCVKTTDLATVATSGSYNDLSDKPTIPSAYTLPTASNTVMGGVKIGSNISVSSGTISITKSNVTSALGYTPPVSDTTYVNATASAAGLMSSSDKSKLDSIAANANNYIHPASHPASMITGLAAVATSGSYSDLTDKPVIPGAYTLPNATSSTLGGVKIGNNISVTNGTISLSQTDVTSALGYTPPTTNTDTHWTTGLKVGASATATANAAATNGNVFLNVLDNTTVRDFHNIVGSGATTVTSDANGKITISSTNTVYTHPTTHPASMITGLATVATSGSYNDLTNKPTIPAAYSLPDATASVKGGVKIGSNLTVSSGTISLTKANVTSALGYTPPASDTTYGDATTTSSGLMSSTDKVKLNGIADNANYYIHPPTHPASMISGLATVATSGNYNDLANKPGDATTSSAGLMSAADKSKLDKVDADAGSVKLIIYS